MEALALAAVLILALLTGLAVPVLLQLRSTLRSAQQFLDATSVSTNQALLEVTQLTARLNRVVSEVETSLPRAQRMLDATDGLVGAIDQMRSSLRVASAVGPAAFAAVKSLISSFTAPATAAPEDVEDIPRSPQHSAAS